MSEIFENNLKLNLDSLTRIFFKKFAIWLFYGKVYLILTMFSFVLVITDHVFRFFTRSIYILTSRKKSKNLIYSNNSNKKFYTQLEFKEKKVS